MQRTQFAVDPFLHDSAKWGASMSHHAELLVQCLDVVRARSIAEVGAYAGDLTRVLVVWADSADASLVAIDPAPEPSLISIADQHERLELIRETSISALARIDLPDVVIIDGDHNYYTVSEELRLIGERSEGDALPLLLFHDVCWPHGRRDDYFDAEQIPAEYRLPTVGEDFAIFPGDLGKRRTGLPYPRSAAREGGPRNGVLTAIEDFIGQHERLRLAVVPAFFGFGVVWHQEAEWASALADVLEPWDGSPLLDRLETNRILHIAQEHALLVELWAAQQRLARQEALLNRLLESSAFGVAERLSRLRVRAGIAPAQSVIAKDEVRRALAR